MPKKQISIEKLTIANGYAWNWFSYHAAQRMLAFRFFFVVIGVITVGYYQTIDQQAGLAFGFALIGFCFVVLFWRIDLRTRELIKIGEALLLEMERQFSSWGLKEAALVGRADAKKPPFATAPLPKIVYSYGQVFSAIFILLLVASVCAATYAANESEILRKLISLVCSRQA